MSDMSKTEVKAVSRRDALVRLGLGSAVVYAAPTITRLDRSAQAGWSGSTCQVQNCDPGRGR